MSESEIKCVGVVVKPNHQEAWATACELSGWLKGRNIRVVGDSYQQSKQEALENCRIEAAQAREFQESVDLIVVLGGDGTMISTARLVGRRETPVLGINYGGLGYLTEFRIEEMFGALEAILAGNYEVESRVMLDVEHLNEAGEKLEDGRVLNEVVLNQSSLARIIEIEVWLDEFFVNSFRADGLIISTPTGSTAYNLSAGGPIIYPSMNVIVLTPICPFTLTNRPIVVPDTAEIKVKLNHATDNVTLTMDGQIGYRVSATETVVIRKSQTAFKLVQPTNRNYFDVLRNKLKWGR
ncbi:MAG: NAD(+)/NADH kinase [Pyrinomonadaceae bacterium]